MSQVVYSPDAQNLTSSLRSARRPEPLDIRFRCMLLLVRRAFVLAKMLSIIATNGPSFGFTHIWRLDLAITTF